MYPAGRCEEGKSSSSMMQQSHSEEHKPVWRHALGALLAWAVLLAGIAFCLRAAIVPPTALLQTAPATQFSALRALGLSAPLGLEVPHPSGSPQIKVARGNLSDRLRQLGLQVTETSASAFSTSDHSIEIGKVSNILARLPGSNPTRPVLLTTHYDSSEHSPGAGGDTAGVLVILEVLRALRSGPTLRNDVIVLFTDGGNIGHLGASYAVEADPSLANAGLILDISNHGDTGVPLLHRTSDGNRRLVQLFAHDVPYPSASSFAYEFADLMKGPSGFDEFRTLNTVPSMSLGAVGGAATYGEPTDTRSRLSDGLIQQLGDNCLALTRSQGDRDLTANPLQAHQDEVFFNWFGHHLVHYPRHIVLPLLFAALLVFGLLLWRGMKADRYSLKIQVMGAFTALLLLLCAPVSMLSFWWCLDRVTPATLLSSSEVSKLYLFLSFLLFGFAATAAVFTRLRRSSATRWTHEAALILTAFLVTDVTMAFRESSFICFWPWACAALVYLGFDHMRLRMRLTQGALVFVGALPSVMLLPFTFYLLFQVMHLDATFMVCGGLLLGGTLVILLPLLDKLAPVQLGWRVPVLLFVLSFTLFGAGFVTRAPTPAHPRSDSLLFALNTDTGKAAWVSLYAGESFLLDKWLQQSLTSKPARDRQPDLLGGYGSYVLWRRAVPPDPLPEPPKVEVLSSSGAGTERVLRLRITQSPRSREIRIHLPAAEIFSVALDEKTLKLSDPSQSLALRQQTSAEPYVPPRPWAIHLYGLQAQPVDLLLHFRSDGCHLLVAERSHGLPLRNGKVIPARPAEYLPASDSDDTVLSRKIPFCK